MRFAVDTPNFGDFSDVRVVADLAREAENAGWDGFFLWDHIGAAWGVPIADPWIELAAMAMVTRRIKLGPLVTPLPRRRPAKLAREAVTLDHLSDGRLILGVGIGSDSGAEFSTFGESPDDTLHAAMLDEGLDVLMGLWSGEPFSYAGTHYTIRDAKFEPRPVQQPRIPIWVAGVWPHKKPFRRAARWDGVCPLHTAGQPTPAHIRELVAYMRAQRGDDTPFDVVVGGKSFEQAPDQRAQTLRAYAEAGATWWLESFDWNNPVDQARAVIRQGPPRLG
jgi:alkanesulfonate monooxygenase SsuD/methylene tetrahydromethanopterin reductase-like flavin-dependent oxidoreductase (luciferase family)